jgi:formate dehydrogenase subunit gamma
VASDPNTVLRFRACERHLHWALAVPFKVCYLTALILVVVYNPAPARPLRQFVSWIHRGSGVCLALLPLATVLWHRRDFRQHLDNVRRAWSWSLDDFKWLALMGVAMLSSRVSLPHQGKFNAAEKINFMVLTLTYPVYLASGLTIWFFGPAFVSWLVHFSLATLATPLILGHVFMATVNPDTRVGLPGMMSGFVDRHWARHHYRLWYDEHFEAPAVSVALDEAAPAAVGDETPVAPVNEVQDGPRHALPGPAANPSFAS